MFKLHSEYKPTGDQPQAIEYLSNGIKQGKKFQTLLGVTGSGKTFTMANIIQQVQKPTLVLAHNKTLAGQLYSEFKEFFRSVYLLSYRFYAFFGVFTSYKDVGTTHHIFAAKVLGIFFIEFKELFIGDLCFSWEDFAEVFTDDDIVSEQSFHLLSLHILKRTCG